MFCPKCGQQQASEMVRFCSRCGFLLESVSLVLSNSGQLPVRYVQNERREMSPRSKGIRQGAMLMLCTLLIVPIVTIITVSLTDVGHILVPITAVVFFIGGLLRMLYALLMEEGYPPIAAAQLSSYAAPVAPQIENRMPPAAALPTWQSRPNTAEIFTPPSVTENTTRLLNKEEPKEN